MENILDRAKKKADAAELYILTSSSTPVQFETNRLKHIESRESTVLALRVIKNGRIGYAVTTGTGGGEGLVDAAVETAEFGQPAKFEFARMAVYPAIPVFDPEAELVTLQHMIHTGNDLIMRILRHTPGIQCSGSVSKGTGQLRIINTNGGDVTYRSTSFGFSVEGTLVRGTDMLFVGDSESSCHPIASVDAVANTVITQLERAKETAAVATKTMPVIFTPDGVASALVTPLMSAFNGKVVYQGASPLGGRIGETVFDTRLNLTDDPTIPFRPASRPCDDEGVPSQRTPLIENGVVKNFLYDLQTAGLAGAKSTGNGERGRGSLPSPSPSAFVITPGNTGFDDMVRDVKEGLLVENLMGAEQGNILNGDFSGNVLLGYKIENGRVAGRVKNTMVAGNVYKMLKDIGAIGNDVKWVGGFLSTPSLYFTNMSVAAKE